MTVFLFLYIVQVIAFRKVYISRTQVTLYQEKKTNLTIMFRHILCLIHTTYYCGGSDTMFLS